MGSKGRRRALLSKWGVFAAWAAVALIFWSWAAEMLTRPSSEETLGVFVCSQSCDQGALVSALQEKRPEYVVQMNFRWVGEDDDLFSVYYDAFAVGESDLIVMPQSRLNEYSYVDFFELDVQAVALTFGRDFEYYRTQEGAAYGIKIDAQASLGAQPADGESYYLFFNKNSLHLGGWNGSARSGALALAEVFL